MRHQLVLCKSGVSGHLVTLEHLIFTSWDTLYWTDGHGERADNEVQLQ